MTQNKNSSSQVDLIELTSELVAAYVAANPLPLPELPRLIGDVHEALERLASPEAAVEERAEPAVPVRQSVTPNHLVCLEDGKKFKSLKRHLASQHGLTPDEYRRRWELPADYPMVAPNYADVRADLARRMGLGKRRA